MREVNGSESSRVAPFCRALGVVSITTGSGGQAWLSAALSPLCKRSVPGDKEPQAGRQAGVGFAHQLYRPIQRPSRWYTPSFSRLGSTIVGDLPIWSPTPPPFFPQAKPPCRRRRRMRGDVLPRRRGATAAALDPSSLEEARPPGTALSVGKRRETKGAGAQIRRGERRSGTLAAASGCVRYRAARSRVRELAVSRLWKPVSPQPLPLT